MNLPDMPLQRRFLGGVPAAGRDFWLTGITFLALYLALNLVTERLDVHRLAITPWSPDNGLSLVLLIESVAFAPFVFAGGVLVDIFVAGVHRGVCVIMGSEFLLMSVYVTLALTVRKTIRLHPSQLNFAEIRKLLLAIPAGAVFSAIVYVSALYICAAIHSNCYFVVLFRFMLGDILGMITIIPGAVVIYAGLPFAKLLSSVYREVLVEDAAYRAKLRILAASRLVFFPNAMIQLVSPGSENPYGSYVKRDPLYFLIHKYYLSKNFTLRQRVQAAMDHRRYEVRTHNCEYKKYVYHSDGLLLWRQVINDSIFRIILLATEDNRHEGDLSVILYVNDARLCRMSFSYLNGAIFGLSSGMTMLISRNQTDRTPARTLFDRGFKQNTPQLFCLAAVCGIAVSNEFKAVLAIKHDSQIAYEEVFDPGFRNSYTELWEKFDAVEMERHVYRLGVPLNLRRLESVESGHRARARNRRRCWDDIFQSACSCMSNYRIASKS